MVKKRKMGKDKVIYKDLSYKIIGAAMEVHKELGCGFLESVYDEAFGYELKKIGLEYDYQKELKIKYKNRILKKAFFGDYVVENKVIIENKAVKRLTKVEEAQMHNYLKATGYKLGIVINYGGTSLEYKRIVR